MDSLHQDSLVLQEMMPVSEQILQFQERVKGSVIMAEWPVRNGLLTEIQQEEDEHSPEMDWKKKKECLKTLMPSLVLMLSCTAGWVGCVQMWKNLVTDYHVSISFLTWFNGIWLIACFPTYLVCTTLYSCALNRPKTLKRIVQETMIIFGSRSGVKSRIFKVIVPFSAVWFLVAYTICQALYHVTTGETSALFLTHPAFAYLLLWMCVHEQFVPLRIMAVVSALIGITFMAHARGLGTPLVDPRGGDYLIAVISGVTAAVFFASYKVAQKQVIGDPNLGQSCLFLSCIGLCNLVLFWPLPLIFLNTKAEIIDWTTIPWNSLCISAALSLLYNFIIHLGKATVAPVYVTLGCFLGLPVTGILDQALRGIDMHDFGVIGSMCILGSILMILVPSDCKRRVSRHIKAKRNGNKRHKKKNNKVAAAIDINTARNTQQNTRTTINRSINEHITEEQKNKYRARPEQENRNFPQEADSRTNSFLSNSVVSATIFDEHRRSECATVMSNIPDTKEKRQATILQLSTMPSIQNMQEPAQVLSEI